MYAAFMKNIKQVRLQFLHSPSMIWQFSKLEYRFYSLFGRKGKWACTLYVPQQLPILHWLVEDCFWNYTIFTQVFHTWDGDAFQTILIFEDVRGAIEFKIRFFTLPDPNEWARGFDLSADPHPQDSLPGKR